MRALLSPVFIFIVVASLWMVRVSVRRARVERRRINLLYDVVGHFGLPLSAVPLVVELPRAPTYIILGVALVLIVVDGRRLVSRGLRGPS